MADKKNRVVNSIGLTNYQIDAVKECGNVGIGHAATALSVMLNKQVKITIPEFQFVKIEDLPKVIDVGKSVATSIYLPITGSFQGESLFVFSQDDAKKMTDLILMQPMGTTKIITESEESAVKEMANIFIGSYLTALSDFLGESLLPNPPHIATDEVKSIIDFVSDKVAQRSDSTMLVKESIMIDNMNLTGVFILLLDKPSIEKLLVLLKKKYNM